MKSKGRKKPRPNGSGGSGSETGGKVHRLNQAKVEKIVEEFEQAAQEIVLLSEKRRELIGEILKIDAEISRRRTLLRGNGSTSKGGVDIITAEDVIDALESEGESTPKAESAPGPKRTGPKAGPKRGPGRPKKSAEAEPSANDLVEAIVAAVEAEPGLSTREIADRLEAPQNRVRTLMVKQSGAGGLFRSKKQGRESLWWGAKRGGPRKGSAKTSAGRPSTKPKAEVEVEAEVE